MDTMWGGSSMQKHRGRQCLCCETAGHPAGVLYPKQCVQASGLWNLQELAPGLYDVAGPVLVLFPYLQSVSQRGRVGIPCKWGRPGGVLYILQCVCYAHMVLSTVICMPCVGLSWVLSTPDMSAVSICPHAGSVIGVVPVLPSPCSRSGSAPAVHKRRQALCESALVADHISRQLVCI